MVVTGYGESIATKQSFVSLWDSSNLLNELSQMYT